MNTLNSLVCTLMFVVKLLKGERWMPWRQEAMKDVADCDKLRGAVKQA